MADGGRWTMDRGRWTVDGGRWTVDGGPWTVDDGPWTIFLQPLRSVASKRAAAGVHRPWSVV